MTTNQEGVHAAVRAVTGTSRSYNEDWHALFDDDGISSGTFNERMLAWINATLGTSYSNLNEAMQAFAVDQGFSNWASMNTITLWSPSSLSPKFWWDLVDVATLFQDTAGATPVTTSGQTVARVSDKSGNGFHAINATASVSPVYTSSVVRFDGADDYLRNATSINPGATGECLIVAAKRTATGSREMFLAFGAGSGAANGGDRWIEISAANNIECNMSYNRAGPVHINAQAATTTNVGNNEKFWVILNAEVGSAPQVMSKKSGGSVTTTNFTNVMVSTQSTTTGQPSLGTLITSGVLSAAADIYSAIYLDRPLTTEEITSVQEYLDGLIA